jgi:hypothetical protein
MRRLVWHALLSAFALVLIHSPEVHATSDVNYQPKVGADAVVPEALVQVDAEHDWHGQDGLLDTIHKRTKEDAAAKKAKEDHQSGYDKWHDMSVIGSLDAPFVQKKQATQSSAAVSRLFAPSYDEAPRPMFEEEDFFTDDGVVPLSQQEAQAKPAAKTEPVKAEEKKVEKAAPKTETAPTQEAAAPDKVAKKPTDDDVMQGLFHDALQNLQVNKIKRHAADAKDQDTQGQQQASAPSSEQADDSDRVQLEPVDTPTTPEPAAKVSEQTEVTDAADSDTAEDTSPPASPDSKLGRLEKEDDKIIAKELGKPLNPAGVSAPVDVDTDRLGAHAESSSAAGEAVIAATKAVGTLQAMRDDAERDVRAEDNKLQTLDSPTNAKHDGSAQAAVMKEASEEAKKTVARLESKEAVQAEKEVKEVHPDEQGEAKDAGPKSALPEFTALNGITEQMAFIPLANAMLSSSPEAAAATTLTEDVAVAASSLEKEIEN